LGLVLRDTTRLGESKLPLQRAETRPAPSGHKARPTPETGPDRRLSSARSARREALCRPRQAQASVPSSFVPSSPSGPRPFRSGDQATHGQFGVRLHDPLRLRTRGFGSKLPRLCAHSPPDATKHKARLCRIADPAGRNRCPRSRATSRTVDAGGEPPLPLAWPSEFRHHEGVLTRKHSAGWQGLQQRAGGGGSKLPLPVALVLLAWRPRGLPRSKALCRWLGAASSAGPLEQAPAAGGIGRPGSATTRAASLGSTLPGGQVQRPGASGGEGEPPLLSAQAVRAR
jgi:hypothetical protein